jgi:uncharacterized BrkB/YihY/UPF0761 family membrane protein
MDTSAVQIIISKLDELLAKVASGVTDFYPLVVKKMTTQAWIETILGGSILAYGLIATIFMIIYFFVLDHDSDDCLGMAMFGSISATLAMIVGPVLFTSGLMTLCNPEYYAVHELLKFVK